MGRRSFTDEQIAMALRQGEAGTPVGEICRKLGIAEVSNTTRRDMMETFTSE